MSASAGQKLDRLFVSVGELVNVADRTIASAKSTRKRVERTIANARDVVAPSVGGEIKVTEAIDAISGQPIYVVSCDAGKAECSSAAFANRVASALRASRGGAK